MECARQGGLGRRDEARAAPLGTQAVIVEAPASTLSSLAVTAFVRWV